MLKRLFDLVSATLSMVFLSPIFLLLAILIKFESNGPVFYRGIRTGRCGRPFRIFKFRTMVGDAENLGGPSTGKDDTRITRIGYFLRDYKFDELPQLINVIKGEMSIVGPRPEVEEYTRLYEGDEELILTIRPGITDYASIEFRNLADVLGDTHVDETYEEVVKPVKNKLRIKYVKERGFFVDMKIIIMTLYRILFR